MGNTDGRRIRGYNLVVNYSIDYSGNFYNYSNYYLSVPVLPGAITNVVLNTQNADVNTSYHYLF